MSVQVFIGFNKLDNVHAVEELTLATLNKEASSLKVLDNRVRTQANLSPDALHQYALILGQITDLVGGGAALLVALQKLVESGSALIATIKLRIGGRDKPLDQVTAAEIDQELKKQTGGPRSN